MQLSSGKLASLQRAVNVDIPRYQQGLDAIAVSFRDAVNAQHRSAYPTARGPSTRAASGHVARIHAK